MIRRTGLREDIERRPTRDVPEGRTYLETLVVFEALWRQARVLNPDFPSDWREDIAPTSWLRAYCMASPSMSDFADLIARPDEASPGCPHCGNGEVAKRSTDERLLSHGARDPGGRSRRPLFSCGG